LWLLHLRCRGRCEAEAEAEQKVGNNIS
jgi:hypothetical protein